MVEQPVMSLYFVACCILAWIGNSALCVLLNKHILHYLAFAFPITLATLHMMSAAILATALICSSTDKAVHVPTLAAANPKFYFQLCGIAALFGLQLVLSNSAFIYVSIPVIQMLKVRFASTSWI